MFVTSGSHRTSYGACAFIAQLKIKPETHVSLAFSRENSIPNKNLTSLVCFGVAFWLHTTHNPRLNQIFSRSHIRAAAIPRCATARLQTDLTVLDPRHCAATNLQMRGRYHGGRRPSSDNSFHSPTVIPPSALDKPSIMKRCHRRRTTR